LKSFFETILYPRIPGKIVIFLDEIDCILNLSFPINDFFAWLRFCYDRRSEDVRYQRLTFALLGVATPTDLMPPRARSPFDIGEAIDLTSFSLPEALPLTRGLKDIKYNSEILLQAILDWTGGQPFLTQKICQLVSKQILLDEENQTTDPTAQHNLTAPQLVEQIITNQVLLDWKKLDQP
jgi:hypothetical protein